MIDLYGLPSAFPGREAAEKLRNDPYQRVASLEAAWANDIGDSRFIPYIQLHEFEACLFVDASCLEFFYPDCSAKIRNLQAGTHAFSTPELIDDGPATSPSNRIIAEFPDYKGAKRVQGPQLGELIGLAQIRMKCPHFDEWFTTLENLK